MKRIIIILLNAVFIVGLAAQVYQPRLAIDKPEFQGINTAEANSIQKLITDAIQNGGDFIFVKAISDSEFYIGFNVRKVENLYNLNLILFETKSRQAVEDISQSDIAKTELEPVIMEGYKKFKSRIFLMDDYLADNRIYFKKLNPILLQSKDYDVISRVKTETNPVRNINPIPSVSENVFKRYPWSVSVSGAAIIPVNLLNQDVSNSFFMDILGEYTFFNSSIIMISAFLGSNYFFLEKPTSSTTSNILHVIGLDTGAGICFPLPFFRQLSLHLNAGGGYGISTLVSIQYNGIMPSGDFFVNGFFEMRFALTGQISLNLNTVYKLIFYSDGPLHNFTVGAGVTYRI